MRKFNHRKLVLMLADVFIIVVSGIVLNYLLSVTNVISAERDRGLIYYLVINLITGLIYVGIHTIKKRDTKGYGSYI